MAATACMRPVAAQDRVVTETISGSIYRYANYVTVDQYTLELATTTALVEFDILSMETPDNVTFTDVNRDCDSAFIDSHIYLFRRLNDGTLQLVAYNDDEGDDNSGYYGRGRRDGSLNTQDSYMIRRLPAGTYILSVGRYPLTAAAARAGKSTDALTSYSPYTCQSGRASYGNYQLTLRVQSISTKKVVKQYANSYVGNSCSVPARAGDRQCVYRLPGDYRKAILDVCGYDKTVV